MSVTVQIPRDFKRRVPSVSVAVRRWVWSLAPHLAPRKDWSVRYIRLSSGAVVSMNSGSLTALIPMRLAVAG